MEIQSYNSSLPTLQNSSSMLDNELFLTLSVEGFKNTNWQAVPGPMLVYLFLHDEPTIGKRRSMKTKTEYLRDIEQFLHYINEEIRTIVPEDALAYQTWLERQKYEAPTLRRKSTVTKQFLQYLYKNGVLSFDASIKMKRVAQPLDKQVNRDLYEHEVEQLLEYFKENDWFAYTLLLLLTSTGLRIEELASANWANLFIFRTNKNQHHFLKVVGKGGKPRDVRIYEDVLLAIFEFRKRRRLPTELNPGDSTAFFAKPSGGHYSSTYLSTEFSKLIERSGFPFVIHRTDRITPHTCRHYTASFLSSRGADIRAIQDALGHASIVTTERYLWRHRRLENHASTRIGQNFFNR
ncbi:tyrosine-type recombinase/integrase [Paenibacillus sp. GYB003]|uniref:tyrosine-type recombinase/integrase n=1 Tax=Paenibacillus sp. GYB003 TaxID=2994392 RepID=UPI002F96B213